MADHAACFQPVYAPPGRYVNDHCFVSGPEGLVHLFHIVGPSGRGCYDPDAEVSFGHAVSRDLGAWEPCPDVLSVDPASRHEPDHLFAPYVVAHAGLYYLFYAGINVTEKTEAMCLATSRDCYTWEKHPANPVFRSSPAWAEYRPGSGTWACCRDPHVLPHPDYGWILYYVTWPRDAALRLAALGAAVSSDLVTWRDAGPVLIREFAEGYSTTSLESPCVVAHEGRYFLFYKHRDGTRLAVSEDPLRFGDREDVLFSPAHACEVFCVGGRWFVSHCSRDLDDVGHERTDRTRGLSLAGLEWEGGLPRVVPFAPLSG